MKKTALKNTNLNDHNRLSFKTYYIYLTVFISGAVVLVIEIAGARLLAPFYGSTIYVWSALISVAMASLSIGYIVGGNLADRFDDRLNKMYWILFASGILLLLLPFYDNKLLIQSNNFGIKYGPLVATTVLFGPQLILLGTISPIAVKEKTERLVTLGSTAGNLYATATAGSLFGALVTGYIIAPHLSLDTITTICGLVLSILFIVWQAINLN